MPTLQTYLDRWGLSEPQPLAETHSSYVYTLRHNGSRAVLKVLKPVAEEERSGALALSYYAGDGAVRLLRSDDGAHLLDYLPGGDLVPLVQAGDDAEATAIIAQVINRLHVPRASDPPPGLHQLPGWFRGLFDRAAMPGSDPIFTRGAAMARKLLADPQDERVLHGDIHHENIRKDSAGRWLVIDPKGLYGDSHYDAANTFYNPMNMPDLVENAARIRRTADILARNCGFDRQRLLAFVFAYGCLSAAWSLEDDWSAADAEATLRIAALAEAEL